jgi:phage-related protein
MAEDVGNLAVKVSMDSTGFQNGVSAINQQLKVVQSEFKAASANLGAFGNSADQLRLKSDSLNKQIDLQKQKVEALEKAYQRSVEKTGANSRSTQDLAIKLNNAKAALANMENGLKETNKQLEESVKKQSLFGKVTDKLHLNLEGFKTAFGAVGVAAGAFLKDAIQTAENAEKTNADLAQTIKSTGGAAGYTAKQVSDMARHLSETTTFSAGTIKAGQAMLLTFTNIGHDVFPQASQAMLDLAQKMKTEPREAAMQLGKALNDPIKGLTALRRVGVSFTQQQEEQIKTMVKHNNVIGAQKVILSELNKEFGGQAAAAANTYEGRMKQFDNTLTNLKATIGTALLPVLTKLLGSLSKILVPIADFIQKNPQFTAAVLAIVVVVGTLIGGLSLLKTVTEAIKILGPVFEGIGEAAGGSIIPVIAVTAAIAAVAAAAYLIYTHWSQITTFFKNLWKEIVSIFTNSGNSIKTFLGNVWNSIKTTVMAVWDGIKTVISNAISNITNVLQPALTFYKSIFQNTWDIIKNIVLGAVLIVIDIVTGNFGKLKSDLAGIWTNIKNDLAKVWEAIKTVASNAWENFKTKIIDLWKTIVNAAKTIWNGLINWFKELPSTLYNIAVNMFNRMRDGVINTIGNVKTAIVNGITQAINWIKGLPAEAIEWGKDMINGFINGIKSMVNSITNTVKGVAQTIRSFLHFSSPDEGPLADYESWMPDFITGLAKGIEDNKKRVQQAIQGLSTDMSLNIKSNVIPAMTTGATRTQQQTIVQRQQPINLNIGTLIADDYSLKQLERKLYNIRIQEAQRMGLSTT